MDWLCGIKEVRQNDSAMPRTLQLLPIWSVKTSLAPGTWETTVQHPSVDLALLQSAGSRSAAQRKDPRGRVVFMDVPWSEVTLKDLKASFALMLLGTACKGPSNVQAWTRNWESNEVVLSSLSTLFRVLCFAQFWTMMSGFVISTILGGGIEVI